MLFPRGCGIRALGVRFNSDIFESGGRPAAWRSETWISGPDDTAHQLPDDVEAQAAMIADRQALTGRADDAVAVHLTRRPQALPVYGNSVLDIQRRLGDLPPGLALAGNYLGRIGAAKLLDVAREAAERLVSLSALRPARARR